MCCTGQIQYLIHVKIIVLRLTKMSNGTILLYSWFLGNFANKIYFDFFVNVKFALFNRQLKKNDFGKIVIIKSPTN